MSSTGPVSHAYNFLECLMGTCQRQFHLSRALRVLTLS